MIDLSSSSSSSYPSTSFVDAVFQVIKSLQSQEKYSFSLGIALSRKKKGSNFEGSNAEDSTPSIARVVPRSDVGNAFSDFSAYDLYLKSVISEDPFDVSRTLLKFFQNNNNHSDEQQWTRMTTTTRTTTMNNNNEQKRRTTTMNNNNEQKRRTTNNNNNNEP